MWLSQSTVYVYCYMVIKSRHEKKGIVIHTLAKYFLKPALLSLRQLRRHSRGPWKMKSFLKSRLVNLDKFTQSNLWGREGDKPMCRRNFMFPCKLPSNWWGKLHHIFIIVPLPSSPCPILVTFSYKIPMQREGRGGEFIKSLTTLV